MKSMSTLRNLYQKHANELESSGYSSLADISQQPFDTFSQTVRGQLTTQETSELYRHAKKYVALIQAEQQNLICRTNPQLKNIKHLAIEPLSKTSVGYEGIYDQRNVAYTNKDSVASMFSPAAYLTQLYQEGLALHDINSAQNLGKRRPDLQSLTLSQANLDTEVSTLTLSNEILRDSIGESDLNQSLSTQLYPFDLPLNIPFNNIEMALDLQKTSFNKLSKILPTHRIKENTYYAFKNHLPPALVDALLIKIPVDDEHNLNLLLKQHFGSDATVESLSSIKTFCQKTGINREELNDYLKLSPLKSSLYVIDKKTKGNTTVPFSISPNEAGAQYLNHNTNVDNSLITVIDEHLQMDTSTILDLPYSRSYLLPTTTHNALTFRHQCTKYTYGHGKGFVQIRIVGDSDDSTILETRKINPTYRNWNEFTIDLNKAVGKSIQINYSTAPENEVPNVWNITRLTYNKDINKINHTAFIKLSQIIRYCKKTGLTPATIDTLIMLSQDKTTQGETTIVAINFQTLQLTGRVLDYMARYSISENDAVILAGGSINIYEKTGETNQFDKLFNSPPLNNQYFTTDDKNTINLSPEYSKYELERSVLKRALSVDDAGLLTLCHICTPGITEWIRSLDNISLLYRVGLWAKLHNLTPQALQLILQLNNKKETLNAVDLQMAFKCLKTIDESMQWLEEQQLSVVTLNAMTTTKYPEILLPEMRNLLENLYNSIDNKALLGNYGLASISAEPGRFGTPLQVDTWFNRAIEDHDSAHQFSIQIKQDENEQYFGTATLEAYSATGERLETKENVEIPNEAYIYNNIPTDTVRIRLILEVTNNTLLSSIPLTITSLAYPSKSQKVATTHILPTESTLPTPAPLGRPPKSLKMCLASHLASSLGLSGIDQAVILQDWIDLIAQEQNLTLTSIDSFWQEIIKLCDNDENTLANNTGLATFCQALGQLSLIIKNWQLSSVELALLIYKPKILSSENVKLSLTLANLKEISDFKHMQVQIGEASNELLAALDQGRLDIPLLAHLLNKPESEVFQAATTMPLTDKGFINVTQANNINLLLQDSERLGISTQSLVRLLELSLYSDSYAWQHLSNAILSGLPSIKQAQITEKQDQVLSVALCAYYQNKFFHSNIRINTRDDIFQYLLIDNQVCSSIITTRIAEAISSIQLYINRCLQGLEVNVNRNYFTGIFFQDWDIYNKRYSTWAGVSQLVYYPENYLDPTLRYNQSNLQQKLLAEISQSRLSKESVTAAYMNYLDSFEEIANLKVLCGYQNSNELNKGKSYFTARSYNQPYTYYWRSLDHEASDGLHGFMASAWTPWEKIDSPIQAITDEVRPVIFNSRLYISWIENKSTPTNNPSVEANQCDLKLSYYKMNGNWSPAITINIDRFKVQYETQSEADYSNGVTPHVIITNDGHANVQLTGVVRPLENYIQVLVDGVVINPTSPDVDFFDVLSIDNWTGDNTYRCKPKDKNNFEIIIKTGDENFWNPKTSRPPTYPITSTYKCTRISPILSDTYLSYNPNYDGIMFMAYDRDTIVPNDSDSLDSPYGGYINSQLEFTWINDWKDIYSYISNNMNSGVVQNKVIRNINTVNFKPSIESTVSINNTENTEIKISSVEHTELLVDNSELPPQLSLSINTSFDLQENYIEPLLVNEEGDVINDQNSSFEVKSCKINSHFSRDKCIHEATVKIDKKHVFGIKAGNVLQIGDSHLFSEQPKVKFESQQDQTLKITFTANIKKSILNNSYAYVYIQLNGQFIGAIYYENSGDTACTWEHTLTREDLRWVSLFYTIFVISSYSTEAYAVTVPEFEAKWAPNVTIKLGSNSVTIKEGGLHSKTLTYIQNLDEKNKCEKIQINISNSSSENWQRIDTLGYKDYQQKKLYTYNWGDGDIPLNTDGEPIIIHVQKNIPSQGLIISPTLIIKEDSKNIYKKAFDVSVSTLANDTPNPTDFFRIEESSSKVQYMDSNTTNPRRTRLNSLFSHELVKRANVSLNRVLSWDTQHLKEPQLGEGTYVKITLSKYDRGIHGSDKYYRLYLCSYFSAYDRVILAEGVLSEDNNTELTLFVPRSPFSYGHKDNLYIIAEYQGKETDNILFSREDKSDPHGWLLDEIHNNGTFEGLISAVALKNDSEPMDFSGANGLYFWELFYYTPMLVVEKLLQAQNFEEAEHWLKYVFSPSGYLEGKLPNLRHVDRQWNMRPLAEDTAWDNSLTDSTDPDIVAQSDPMHYKVATYMKLIELLLARGDMAYRQLERDTLAEAKMWYVTALDLLGNEPDLPLAENWQDPTLGVAASKATQAPLSLGHSVVRTANTLTEVFYPSKNSKVKAYWQTLAQRLYNFLGDDLDFPISLTNRQKIKPLVHPEIRTANALSKVFHPSENEKLKAYWQTLNQRLYNLRHNLSISGEPLTLPLYATPADPKALQNAAAAAGNIGNAHLPRVSIAIQRFPVMLESARGLVNQLIQFGDKLTAIRDNKDNEALGILLQTQASDLVAVSLQLQDKTIEQLQAEHQTLLTSLQGAQSQYDSYQQLLDEGVSTVEKQCIEKRIYAASLSGGIGAMQTAAAALNILPNTFGLANGGGKWGAAFEAAASGIGVTASILTDTAEANSISEQYRRREQEWAQQRDASKYLVQQIKAQQVSLEIQVKAAQLQKNHIKMQQAQTQEQLNLLKTKFSNAALYSWLQGRLSAVFYQFYDITIARSLKAQLGYQWETRDSATFIQPGAWNDNHAGLLCGEALMLNLAQMEAAYIDRDIRALEVQRTVSMALAMKLNSAEFTHKIKETLSDSKSSDPDNNVCKHTIEFKDSQLIATINLSSLALDQDYPENLGTTRRIKQVSVSLPALLGPYQDIQAILAYSGAGGGIHQSCRHAAISHGLNDSGLFQLDFNDSKYLPFEGLPIVGEDGSSSLSLSFPNAKGKQQALLESLSDIILHIRYTIRN